MTAIALVAAYVALAIALDIILAVALRLYSASFLLRDPLADIAAVVGLALGATMAYRTEKEQRGVGLLVGFCFGGGVVFLAQQFVVPGALGNMLLDAAGVALAAPGIAFATAAPVIAARRRAA